MAISYTSAVFLVVLVSFMWGFWHQFIRKIGTWPLASFMIWMEAAGSLVVWGMIALFREQWIPQGIPATIQAAPRQALTAFVCGVGFSTGMMINLYVVSAMGLIYSTSITSTVSIILGTVLAGVLGGFPADVSKSNLFLGALILLCASYLCQAAMLEKNKSRGLSQRESKKTNLKFLGILLGYLLVFSQSYTIGMSLSVRTELRPEGLPGPLAVGMLALGALAAVLVLCTGILVKKGQLSTLWKPPKKRYILYALVGGTCCLGGDLIHNIASPVLSIAIAFPLAHLSGVWQYFWGLVSGEFRGSNKKAKLLLLGGILCYMLGVVWIALSRSGIL